MKVKKIKTDTCIKSFTLTVQSEPEGEREGERIEHRPLASILMNNQNIIMNSQ